jgi:CheY-like chemotaxis protein
MLAPSTTSSKANTLLDIARTNRVLDMQCLVLSADDEIVRPISSELRRFGISARHHGISDALELVRHERFDLVVLDCVGIDAAGDELLRALRATPSNRKVTTLAVADAKQHASNAATLTLQRPFSAQALARALHALMGSMLQERRRTFRLPVEISALVTLDRGPATQVTVVNISEEGMAIQAPVNAAVSEHVTATFALPNSKTRVELEGVIVWSDKRGRAGIHIRNVQPAIKRAFDTWLRTTFERLLQELKQDVLPPSPMSAHLTLAV